MEVESSETEVQRLRHELKLKDDTLAQLKLKTKSFVDNMKIQLHNEKVRADKAEKALSANVKGSQNGELQDVDNNLANQLEKANHEISLLKEREETLKLNTKAFIGNLRQQLDEKSERCRTLEVSLESAQNQYQSALEQEKQKIADCHASMKKLESEKENMSIKFKKEIQILKEDKEQQLQSMGISLEESRKLLQSTTESREEINLKLTTSQEQFSNLERQFHKRESENGLIMESLNKRIDMYQEELNSIQSSSNSHLEEIREENAKLKSELDMMNTKYNNLSLKNNRKETEESEIQATHAQVYETDPKDALHTSDTFIQTQSQKFENNFDVVLGTRLEEIINILQNQGILKMEPLSDNESIDSCTLFIKEGVSNLIQESLNLQHMVSLRDENAFVKESIQSSHNEESEYQSDEKLHDELQMVKDLVKEKTELCNTIQNNYNELEEQYKIALSEKTDIKNSYEKELQNLRLLNENNGISRMQELETLKDFIKTEENDKNNLLKEIEDLKKNKKDQENKTTELETVLSNLRSSNMEIKELLETAKIDNEKYKQEINNLTRRLTSETENRIVSSSKILEQSNQIQELDDEKKKFEEMIRTEASNKGSLLQEVSKLQQTLAIEKSKHSEHIRTLEDSLQSKSDSLSKLESEKIKLVENVHDAHDIIERKSERIHELDESVLELRTTLRNEKQDWIEDREKLCRTIEELTSLRDQLKNSEEALESRISNICKDNLLVKEQLEHLIREKDAEVDGLKSENLNLTSSINLLKKSIEGREADVQAKSLELDEKRKRFSKEVIESQNEVETHKKKRLTAKAETEKISQKLDLLYEEAGKAIEATSTVCVEQVQILRTMLLQVDETSILLDASYSINENLEANALNEISQTTEEIRITPLYKLYDFSKLDKELIPVTENIRTLEKHLSDLCYKLQQRSNHSMSNTVMRRLSGAISDCFYHRSLQYTRVNESSTTPRSDTRE